MKSKKKFAGVAIFLTISISIGFVFNNVFQKLNFLEQVDISLTNLVKNLSKDIEAVNQLGKPAMVRTRGDADTLDSLDSTDFVRINALGSGGVYQTTSTKTSSRRFSIFYYSRRGYNFSFSSIVRAWRSINFRDYNGARTCRNFYD